ncbi:MAG TPA: energy-coupling factor ABC transporter permease [Acidimicrobiia bacterium]|nr:energy-coupling factor ABC transporter permease [Acidimicrobiia bacterium]
MHIPDGFIGPGVSVAAGITALGGFGVALRKTHGYLTDRLVPMAALVAAFVFAAQMINFPVLPGMSGHLLGGVLAAVLVGPWAGCIVVSLVLIVQALLFADGGLSALGLNIVNMALIGAVGGYVIYRALFRLGGSRASRVPPCAGLAALISVPLAAMGFVLEFALGGTVESISLGSVFWAMLGANLLIGVGEGLITFLVIGAVMRSRSDLVYGSPTFGGARSEELVS